MNMGCCIFASTAAACASMEARTFDPFYLFFAFNSLVGAHPEPFAGPFRRRASPHQTKYHSDQIRKYSQDIVELGCNSDQLNSIVMHRHQMHGAHHEVLR